MPPDRGRDLVVERHAQAYAVLSGLDLPTARDVHQRATQRETALAAAVTAGATHPERYRLLDTFHDRQVECLTERARGPGAPGQAGDAEIRGPPAERDPRLFRRGAQRRLYGDGDHRSPEDRLARSP